MEAILALYDRPSDPKSPRLCFDERPCQLIDDVLTPISMKPGQVQKEDGQYKRNGTCVVLLAYNMDTGQRHLWVTERRTKKEYAHFMAHLVNECYPEAEKITLIQDNLNTHTKGSFYEHFSAEQAYHLAAKIEMHYTPKHGSWLNMAEIEFSALSRQCLDRRIADKDTLEKEALIWQEKRNRDCVKIHWSFTVDKARNTLCKKYNVVNQNNF